MKNPFFGDDFEPEKPEPVNPFLYPERVEQRAKVLEREPERDHKLRLPKKVPR